MQIKKIRLSSLRNEEWFQFFTEFKTLIEEQPLENMSITEQYPKFLSLYGDADNTLEQIRKSQYTAEIARADVERDTTFSGFRDIVKGMQSHFDPAKRKAAANLMIVFSQYGNISKKSYSEETASIHNFLQEMRNKFASDIETLGLQEWVDMLDQNNQEFSSLMLQRNEETSQKTSLRMKDLRTEIENCYVEMIKCMEAVTILQSDHTLTEIINKLNANLTRYSNTLAQRQGKAAAQKGQLIDAIASKPSQTKK
ncbi:MAG: DUF6261 family protein [Bacteroidales bacterium]|jgi:hypothetical protein|nr:DUF6261 family protein [Bacteroidales bacterium]